MNIFKIEVNEGDDWCAEVNIIDGSGNREHVYSDTSVDECPEDLIWRRDIGSLFRQAFELGCMVGAGEASVTGGGIEHHPKMPKHMNLPKADTLAKTIEAADALVRILSEHLHPRIVESARREALAIVEPDDIVDV